MRELAQIDWEEILNKKPGVFINRLGGTDADLMFEHFHNTNGVKTLSGNAEVMIRKISMWNGYYDLSTDPLIRKNNLLKFFEKLDECYSSNEYQSLDNLWPAGEPYLLALDSYYFIYSVHISNPYVFLKSLETFSRNKKILVVNSFTDQIKDRIPYLNNLYAGNINLDCSFEFVKTPLTYYDEGKGYLNVPHNNFLETAEHICLEVDKKDYDIALLGCGSYAHFIGEHIKSNGKKAIYVGGFITSIFGLLSDRTIKGRAFPSFFDFNYVTPLLSDQDLSHTFNPRLEALSDYLYHPLRHKEYIDLYNRLRPNLNKHVFACLCPLKDPYSEYFFVYHVGRMLKKSYHLKRHKELLKYLLAYNYSQFVADKPHLINNKLNAFVDYLSRFKSRFDLICIF